MMAVTRRQPYSSLATTAAHCMIWRTSSAKGQSHERNHPEAGRAFVCLQQRPHHNKPAQGSLYMDTAGTAGNILWIKRDTVTDTTGWILT